MIAVTSILMSVVALGLSLTTVYYLRQANKSMKESERARAWRGTLAGEE